MCAEVRQALRRLQQVPHIPIFNILITVQKDPKCDEGNMRRVWWTGDDHNTKKKKKADLHLFHQ